MPTGGIPGVSNPGPSGEALRDSPPFATAGSTEPLGGSPSRTRAPEGVLPPGDAVAVPVALRSRAVGVAQPSAAASPPPRTARTSRAPQ